MIIAAHCEEQSIISKNSAFYKKYFGEDVDINISSSIRSEEACYNIIITSYRIGQRPMQTAYSFISQQKELSLLENRALEDKQITAEVCIAHLLSTG